MSWSAAAQPGATIIASGKGEYVTYSQPSTSISTPRASTPIDISYTQTLDGQGNLASLEITGAATPGRFNFTQGDSRDSQIFIASADLDRRAVVARPGVTVLADYQSFGLWVTGASSRAGAIGAASFGAVSPAAVIPTSGRAEFFGKTLAYQLSSSMPPPPPSATGFYPVGSMSMDTWVNIDFAARTSSFQTSGFSMGQDSKSFYLSGSLNVAPGQNALSGTLSALPTGGGAAALSGNAMARFYGPAAQELGGTFYLIPPDATSEVRLIGAFGVRQR